MKDDNKKGERIQASKKEKVIRQSFRYKAFLAVLSGALFLSAVLTFAFYFGRPNIRDYIVLAFGLSVILSYVGAYYFGYPIGLLMSQIRMNQNLGAEFNSEIFDVEEFWEIAHSLENYSDVVEMRNNSLIESEARYKNILDNVVDAIIVINEQGFIVSFNKSAEKIFGYKSFDVLGKNVSMLMPKHHAEKHNFYIKNYLKTGQAKIIGVGQRELRAVHRKGHTFDIELAVSKAQGKNGTLFTGIVRDITERKRTARELRRAKGAADRANVAKGEYLAQMTHELKAPVNAILGYGQLLEEDFRVYGHRQYEKDVQSLLKATRHIDNLISEVQDFSKLESGNAPLNPTIFNLPELIGEVEDIVLPLFESSQNLLKITTMLGFQYIFADKDKVKQILINLLSNANKFTQKGEVELGIKALDRDGESGVQFTVKDSGVGIPKRYLKDIFEPFKQGPSQITNKKEGSGLGLSICSRLTKLMDGKIEVSSEEGKGSTFSLYLPNKISEDEVIRVENKDKSTEGLTVH